MKSAQYFYHLFFYFLVFSVFHTIHSMDLSDAEEGSPKPTIKKERALCERGLNHSPDLKFAHKPMVAQQSVPLFKLSPQKDQGNLSIPKTPPQNIKIVIEKGSPDLIPVRSPLISTKAAPFRSKTPPLLDSQGDKSPSSLEPVHSPFALTKSSPFGSKTPPLPNSQDGKEGLLEPKRKVVLKKASPDLAPVRSPLISTKATPLRSRSPSPFNP